MKIQFNNAVINFSEQPAISDDNKIKIKVLNLEENEMLINTQLQQQYNLIKDIVDVTEDTIKECLFDVYTTEQIIKNCFIRHADYSCQDSIIIECVYKEIKNLDE